MRFKDRADAGQALSRQLSAYARRPDVIVLGLPRGGVPVAAEVARALGVPLDLFLVRKLGVPAQPELAMGAIAEGGVEIVNHDLVHALRIAPGQVEAVAAHEREEFSRRQARYRSGRAGPRVAGRTVILVDDGVATGSTMQAAIAALRRLDPRRIIVAVPVGERDTLARFAGLADQVVSVLAPEDFRSVGQWYELFQQTSDAEVIQLLADAAGKPPAPSGNDKL